MSMVAAKKIKKSIRTFFYYVLLWRGRFSGMRCALLHSHDVQRAVDGGARISCEVCKTYVDLTKEEMDQ